MSRVIECPDCGWQSSSQANPWTVLAAHKPHCRAKQDIPRPVIRPNPKPITTTTKETPMEKPTMPAPEVLVEHDNRRVAKAAERVLAAQEALREAWEADAGKAALRAKRDRLKAQLAAVEAEIKGAAPKPKPAPAPEAKVDYRAVRAWAEANGYDAPKVGRISGDVVAAYDEAMRGGAA